MAQLLTRPGRHDPARLSSDAGITLIEVLVAILITGVGLLALLTLFPLGALEMAQDIKDDRTAGIAARAQALSDTGEALIGRTLNYAQVSLEKGSADPDEAGQLRDEYAEIVREAADLEKELIDLQYAYPRARIQRYVEPLLVQIRAIERQLGRMIEYLALIEEGTTTT